jgi:hypothetical protein
LCGQAGQSSGIGVLKVDVQIGGRKQAPRMLGPFDKNYSIFLQNFSEPSIQPLAWIAKPIEIKVIEV